MGFPVLLLIYTSYFLFVGVALSVRHANADVQFPAVRHLSPATVPSALQGRSIGDKVLKREASFEYLDAENPATPESSTFATSVTVRGQQPILPLEDLDLDLREVVCSPSEIRLLFDSSEKLEQVERELKESKSFVAITSHTDCNGDDERAPHLVENVSMDPKEKSITLSKTSCEWGDAFTSAEFSFSRETQGQVLHRRHENWRRQATTTEAGRKFPSPTVSPSAVPSSAGTNLNMSIVEKPIFPPEFPGSELLSLAPIPEGVALNCKKCLLGGRIDLSQGRFKIGDADGLIDKVGSAIQFFQEGSIQLDIDRMFAHIELELEFDRAQGLFNYSVPLPAIPITPFGIPGVVQFGVMLRPQILVTTNLNQAMEFSYGFNMSVPDNSGFTIDVGNLTNSSVTGFGDTVFRPLNFQSSQGVSNMLFTLGFTPEILLGVQSPIGSSTGGIGAFFNLPEVTVNVTQLDAVDQECNPLPDSDSEGEAGGSDDLESTTDKLVGNFTHIEPSVELNLGPFAELAVDIGKLQTELAVQKTILSKEFPLPTACLAFDEENKSYGAPEAVATEPGDGGDGGDGSDGGDGESGDDGDGREGSAGRVSPDEVQKTVWLCAVLASGMLILGVGL